MDTVSKKKRFCCQIKEKVFQRGQTQNTISFNSALLRWWLSSLRELHLYFTSYRLKASVLSAHNCTIFQRLNIQNENIFFLTFTHGDSAHTWQLYQPPPLANNSPIVPKWARMLRDNSFLSTTVHFGCLITTNSLCAWLIERGPSPYKYVTDRALECQRWERYFPCHKEPSESEYNFHYQRGRYASLY